MSDMSTWQQVKDKYYNANTLVLCGIGSIDFSPANMSNVKNGNFVSYDEYLEVQYKSQNTIRQWFEKCYYESICSVFKGKIHRIDIKRKRILFSKIYVYGTYEDGACFRGKEDHVWMDIKGFEGFKVGDNVEFCGDIYRYRKQSGDRLINYGVSPTSIKKIDEYELPTNEELTEQAIQELKCEVCLYREQCYGICLC